MNQIKDFLVGKKTYLSAALIALVAIFGWWFGVVNDAQTLAMLGAAGAAAGLGAKSQRTSDAIMTALADVREAQAKATVNQKIDPKVFAADLSKHLMSQFAGGGLVRSTPAGAVSNVTPIPGMPFVGAPSVHLPPSDGTAEQGVSSFAADLSEHLMAQSCVYCGQPIASNNTVCTDPRNTSKPDTVGNRHHVFFVAGNGSAAK